MDIDILQKAIQYTRSGKLKEAEEIYTKLLSENSEEPILFSAAGLFYITVKNYDKAIELLKKAYEKQKTIGTISALGFAEYERKNYPAAAEYLIESLNLGENFDIYEKLVASLFELHDFKRAIEYSEKMYSLYPDKSSTNVFRVKSYINQGKLMEAQEICINYLKEHQNDVGMWFQLGYLKELIYCDDKKAKECYKVAVDLGSINAYYNVAVSAEKLGEFEEAEQSYKKVLEYYPDSKEAELGLGMCYLKQRKFNEGYELFYKRDKEQINKCYCNFWQKGDKIQDDVTIICEQGFGDHMQFARYLPLIPAKNITVASRHQLLELFQNNYANIKFIDHKDIDKTMQSMRITDLAYILGMDFDHIPFSEGYLSSDTADIKSNKLKVGLCWEAGAAGIRNMINRTIHVRLFEPILNLENIQVYSFQYSDTFKGNEKYPQMINLAKDFKNFSDTARALKAMDVVVTVDTSVAHLAGALGVKTYLLLPYSADWRWFDDTKTTPWYKSIEIFKQNDPISWEKPLKDIISKLV